MTSLPQYGQPIIRGEVGTSGSSGSGSGDATDENQALEIAALAAILAKIIAAPATSALQSTGNTSLSSMDTKTPALGQAVAGSSVPVILPSATITTLTPPAAITGFATSAKQDILAAQIPTTLGIKTAAASLSVAPASDATYALASASYKSEITVTRPANQTPYTAGDVVGATAAAITFTTIGPTSGHIMVTSVDLRYDVAAVPSGMNNMRLHLYSATPPSALADNAAWDLPSGDRDTYIGYLDLGTPVDMGSTLFTEVEQVNKHITMPAGTSLYGYLQTPGAYTPLENSTVFQVTLHAISL